MWVIPEAYLIRDGQLHQVSKDHSLVARLVEQGRIGQEEAKNHPHSHILLRTVGTERENRHLPGRSPSKATKS